MSHFAPSGLVDWFNVRDSIDRLPRERRDSALQDLRGNFYREGKCEIPRVFVGERDESAAGHEPQGPAVYSPHSRLTRCRATRVSRRQGNVIYKVPSTTPADSLGLRQDAAELRDIIGGHWSSMKAVLLDFAVAAGFWIVWTAVAIGMNFVTGPSHAETLGFLTPRGAVEVTPWVTMSVTAGFCEELAYRGYFQRQVLALTRSATLAVLAQAVLFGVGHWYQGSKMVIVITVLGLLFGILAYWRKSLRPGMISHAWSDILNVIPLRFP